jgi:hypothetical protein
MPDLTPSLIKYGFFSPQTPPVNALCLFAGEQPVAVRGGHRTVATAPMAHMRLYYERRRDGVLLERFGRCVESSGIRRRDRKNRCSSDEKSQLYAGHVNDLRARFGLQMIPVRGVAMRWEARTPDPRRLT